MLDYVEAEYKGLNTNKHGGTEQDHIRALVAMGAMKAPDKPKLPTEISYLYDAYRKLKFSRVANENHNPSDKDSPAFKLIPRPVVQYNELYAFSKLSGIELEPWEVDTIMKIDGIFENSRGG